MIKQYHLYISGDVQGVALRYSLAQRARLLSLFGWVKNLDNGQVEAVIQGEEKNIKDILDWLPTHTQIDEIKIKKEPLEKFKGFEIKF